MPFEISRQDQRRSVLGMTGYLRRRIIQDVQFRWTLLEYGTGFRVDLEADNRLIGFLYSQPQQFLHYYVPIHDYSVGIILASTELRPLAQIRRVTLTQQVYGNRANYRAWVFLEERYHEIARADYLQRVARIEAGWPNDYFKRTTAR